MGWAMCGRACRAANHARRARGPVLFCLRLLREFDRMTDSHQIVMRRSMILWIGTAILIAFNLFAASQHTFALTYAALAATGVFVLVALGFGIWAARMVTRPTVSGPNPLSLSVGKGGPTVHGRGYARSVKDRESSVQGARVYVRVYLGVEHTQ